MCLPLCGWCWDTRPPAGGTPCLSGVPPRHTVHPRPPRECLGPWECSSLSLSLYVRKCLMVTYSLRPGGQRQLRALSAQGLPGLELPGNRNQPHLEEAAGSVWTRAVLREHQAQASLEPGSAVPRPVGTCQPKTLSGNSPPAPPALIRLQFTL